jgi:hypothetical protein
MFGQPFVLQQMGSSGLFSNGATVDALISILMVIGIGALIYAVTLVAKAPDRAPRVHLKPEHRRKKRRHHKPA